MRYQVPQFVDIEDKIIGPFTLKQFLMYVVAVMILIPIYLASDLSLFITIALPVIGVAAAFAHVKIGSKTLFETLLNALNHTLNGQFYIWRRMPHAKPLQIGDGALQQEAVRSGQTKTTSLTYLAQSLETQGNTVKSEEVEDILDTESKK